MEKEQFIKLWFSTWAVIAGLAALISLVTADLKSAIVAFAVPIVVAVIVYVYMNELLFKKKIGPIKQSHIYLDKIR